TLARSFPAANSRCAGFWRLKSLTCEDSHFTQNTVHPDGFTFSYAFGCIARTRFSSFRKR
ncbi:hypothetical protein GB927_014885, partial [Shinella sp. CPCC 100929]